MDLTAIKVENVQLYYPGLKLIEKDGKPFLIGELRFNASYDFSKDELVLNPLEPNTYLDYYISDSFQLEIEFPNNSFPLVREVGGRIQKIAEKYGIRDIRDLHVNKNQNDAVCLCPKPSERLRYPTGIDLLHFLNNLVVPFFYGLSYYEKNHKWPWSEYGHGDLGIFEFYAENKNESDIALAQTCYDALSDQGKKLIKVNKDMKGHWPCICGSKEKFRKCHNLALQGLWNLKEIIK